MTIRPPPPDTYEYEYAFLLTRLKAAKARVARRKQLRVGVAALVAIAVGIVACQTPAILTAPQPNAVCNNYERECVKHRGWCCNSADDCGGDVPGCQGDDCCYAATDIFGDRGRYPMRHAIIPIDTGDQ